MDKMTKIAYLKKGQHIEGLDKEAEIRPKDVTIGYPVYDGRPELASIQTLLLNKDLTNNCIVAIQYSIGDSLVTRARNRIVQKFLESESDYLFFIDSDIQFTISDINRIREHGKTIMGGVYLKKKIPYSPVANSVIGEEGDLLLMKEVGTGFVCIHRSVFEDIRAMQPEHSYMPDDDEDGSEYYDWFRVGVVEEAGRKRYLSEDYYFCYLARLAGHKVYYDPSVFTRHIGRAVYPFKDRDLLLTCADLLDKYNTEIPIDMEVLDSIEAGVNKQREARK